MISRLVVLGLLLMLAGPQGVRAADRSEGLAIFSKLDFNRGEGEYLGLQIVLVSYGYGKSKLLWRSGTGALDEPLLLDVVQEGSVVHVRIPEQNDYAGDWTLTMKNGRMLAEEPRNLRFVLSRLQVH